MKFDFEKAAKQGLDASLDRESNLEEINKLIQEVGLAVMSLTEKKVKLTWRHKSYSALYNLSKMQIRTSDVEIQPISNEERVIFVHLTSDENVRHDLTVLNIDTKGFPCEMNVSGNKLISHDIESLADNFKILLSSPFFGQKVRDLILKGA